ncbi:MAG: AMP-binding protein [Chloroflexi bacterium]|nr:AMP-binding protein [Chloroflexota bacterium]
MAKPTRYTSQEIDRLVKSGVWQTTISNLWDRNAEQHPRQKAIADLTVEYTWAEAKTWIDRVALGLIEMGINRDEALVVQLPNSLELHLLRVACEKAGILCVPVLSNMRESEMKYISNYTEAVALVVTREFRGFDYVNMANNIRHELPMLRQVLIAGGGGTFIDSMVQKPLEKQYNPDYLEHLRYRPDEVSTVLLTSGTTGSPKLVEYPAGAGTNGGQYLADALGLTRNDIVAAISPASRGPNVAVYYSAPQVAASIVMVPWLGASEALWAIKQKRVTVACLVPTQLSMMLAEIDNQAYDLSSVRIWLCAGSPLSPSLASAVEKKMGGVVISQYGAVDFGAISISRPEDSFAVRAFTVGKPCLGVTIKITDDSGRETGQSTVGEVLAKGPNSASGYYRDAKATQETWTKEGWFATGDLGKLDDTGNLIIVGRKKDIIIRGGQNIYPSEMESLLITHPNIRSVAVVAMPDSVMGEKACAYIVLNGKKTLTLEDLASFLKKKKIAPFKIPERIEIVDKLPTISDGQKIDKMALVQDLILKLKPEETRR